ncbi:abortive infection protein [Geobacillus subterraneus]|uniref:Abortive infection protein n=2 Tax=Geobacillus TaxID=129337 RepID=A0ABN4NJ65_9BACL|nr:MULTISPECIES: type II CAAX endopeptidase family protein [Geobacillus]AMX84743.1 abortive infection protein [Geobacillus subterraneus]KZS25631.1 abortive infection protein [Geobacillus subterraneus]OXB85568.1 CPBP family intramembrane metalloprotease [Geobacillus uzenensis]
MKRHYWYIMITYIAMQLSAFIGVPLLRALGVGQEAETRLEAAQLASGYWAVISFLAAFVIILWLLRGDRDEREMRQLPLASSWMWAIFGVVLALAAQSIAANIEWRLLGIEPGSENTRQIINIIRLTPLLVIVTSVIGPILEELIFRKIIFGSLYKKYNFWPAALVSSLLFAVVHMELEHLLLYTAMGLTFAFLYAKTGRIFVPIFAHVAMNTFVVTVQLLLADELENMMRQAELPLAVWRFWL